MTKDQIHEWTSQAETVTSAAAAHPDKAPGELAQELYKKSKARSLLNKVGLAKGGLLDNPTQEDLDWAAKCGRFTERPSDLFLKIYANILHTLDDDPLAGLVSPPLLAATGTIPLSVISVIPDHMRHYSNMIVRAEHECLIATNFLEPSHSAKLIANALRELSRKVGERGGKKVIVKFMYDRGAPKQMVENHMLVPPEQWPDVDLPKPEEMPNVDMQIVNFHRPPVGTFHSKFAIFDRKAALLSSCNMQDRVNVEMSVHVEGAIVDSFYDTFLLSWHIAMNPSLPLLDRSVTKLQGDHAFQQDNEHLQHIDVEGSKREAKQTLDAQHEDVMQKDASTTTTTSGAQNSDQAGVDPTADGDVTPRSDVDDAAENTRQLSEMDLKHSGRDGLARHLDVAGKATAATTDDPVDDFNPHVLHAPHKPFPIAMVNRRPHGRPGHGDTKSPQDAAWLSGFLYAKQKVFIQTPTFNATDVVRACLEACQRGVAVTLWLDLGFNDLGEMIPFQGGTNEDVIQGMYKTLHKSGHAAHLKVYWYVGKDQKVPLNASEKSRNCHVKFASFDDQVAVVGNGNQDTQSWYHSQEINILVDSADVIKEWHDALTRNQNTSLHGLVEDDGIWRYPDGRKLEGLATKKGGPVKGLTKGVGGALARLRGTGGF